MPPGAPLLGADTALLILVAAGLLYLAKTVFSLRREVTALRALPGKPVRHFPDVPPAVGNTNGPSPEICAAIAAAIAVALEPGHRVVSITNAPTTLWSQEGRRQVFQSHRVR